MALPSKSLKDKSFVYVNSDHTDIRKRFAAEREKLERSACLRGLSLHCVTGYWMPLSDQASQAFEQAIKDSTFRLQKC